MSGKAATRRARTKARDESGRLDATPERLARAAEAGQKSERGADKLRRLVDPFDVMRSTRALAPHDPRLNDLRWLIGEALRRLHRRAELDALRAAPLDRVGGAAAPGPRSGLPASEIALYARDKLRAAAALAGPAAWPVLTRVVVEGASLRDCPPPGAGDRHAVARRRRPRRPPARRPRSAGRNGRRGGAGKVSAAAAVAVRFPFTRSSVPVI
jgi:hypothetical protein